MRKRTEANFLSEIKKAADVFGFYYHKLPDSIFHTGSEARFSPVKRFDFYLIQYPYTVACEAKATNGRLAFSSLRETEEEWLLTFEEKSGYPAYVIVNFRSGRVYNRTFIIRIKDFIKLREESTRKSVVLDMVTNNSYWIEVEKVKVDNKSYWNISTLLWREE